MEKFYKLLNITKPSFNQNPESINQISTLDKKKTTDFQYLKFIWNFSGDTGFAEIKNEKCRLEQIHGNSYNVKSMSQKKLSNQEKLCRAILSLCSYNLFVTEFTIAQTVTTVSNQTFFSIHFFLFFKIFNEFTAWATSVMYVKFCVYCFCIQSKAVCAVLIDDSNSEIVSKYVVWWVFVTILSLWSKVDKTPDVSRFLTTLPLIEMWLLFFNLKSVVNVSNNDLLCGKHYNSRKNKLKINWFCTLHCTKKFTLFNIILCYIKHIGILYTP